MFFYRFICFVSLVTNVTKKSSKSFWDRKGLCNQFAWVGLGQKGFEAVFSSYIWDFSYRPSVPWRLSASQGITALHGSSGHLGVRRASLELHSDSRTSRRSPSSLELLSVHRHHWTALALLCPPPSPRRPEGKERRPADAERPGCAGCLAQSDGLDRDERPHVGHPF